MQMKRETKKKKQKRETGTKHWVPSKKEKKKKKEDAEMLESKQRKWKV